LKHLKGNTVTIMNQLFQKLKLLSEDTLMIFLRKWDRPNSTLQI